TFPSWTSSAWARPRTVSRVVGLVIGLDLNETNEVAEWSRPLERVGGRSVRKNGPTRFDSPRGSILHVARHSRSRVSSDSLSPSLLSFRHASAKTWLP